MHYYPDNFFVSICKRASVAIQQTKIVSGNIALSQSFAKAINLTLGQIR